MECDQSVLQDVEPCDDTADNADVADNTADNTADKTADKTADSTAYSTVEDPAEDTDNGNADTFDGADGSPTFSGFRLISPKYPVIIAAVLNYFYVSFRNYTPSSVMSMVELYRQRRS